MRKRDVRRASLVVVVAALCALASVAMTPRSADQAGAAAAVPDPAGRSELVELRSEHSRTFRTADGVNETTFSRAPLNYRDDAGDWRPIDTTLERRADGSLVTAAGAFEIRLPEHAAGEVSVSQDDAALGFRLLGAADASTARAEGDEAVFDAVLPGVTATYEAKPDGLKETLVLAGTDAPLRYEYALDAPGLTASLDASGDVVFADGAGAERFRLAAPWMRDAAGALSTAAAYELSTVDGGQRLTLRLDAAWLHDAARRFPIEVDPTVTGDPDGMCTIRSGASASVASCAAAMPVWVGRNAGVVNRAVVAVPEIGEAVPDEALVIDARLEYELDSRTTTNGSQLALHALTRDVGPSTTWNRATATTAWTTPGGDLRTAFESRRSIGNGEIGYRVSQTMPRYVQQLLEERAPSNGLLLKAVNESVNHVDVLEDFNFSVRWHDRFGIGAHDTVERLELPGEMRLDVSLGSGNLLLTSRELADGGYRGRALTDRHWSSLAAGYVGAYGAGEEGDFGSIALEELPDGAHLLHGHTGIEGVFVLRSDGTFDPPPGIAATLREHPDDSYTLHFDDTMETWTFGSADDHRLVRAEDAYGHALEGEYDSLGRIERLEGSEGGWLEYHYDGASDEVEAIEESDGEVHRYAYDGGGDLATYTDPENRVTTYTRDAEDRVTGIEWHDGSQLEVQYWPGWFPRRIRLDGPGGTPLHTIEFDGDEDSPPHATVVRDGEPTRRYDFVAEGVLATSLVRSPTAATTLTLGGRVAGAMDATLAPGTHQLTFAAADAGGVARVDVEVDGFVERSWNWDCTRACAASQSGTWNLNTADFPAGEHVVRVIATAASGEQRAQAVRVVVPHTGLLVSPRTRLQPTIEGRAADGETLTAATSRWAGQHPMTFQAQWRRCNAAGVACQDIAGENGWRYVATGADVGSTLVVTVRGRNARGVGTTHSVALGPIAAAPPVNVQLPEVLGRPTADDPTLMVDDGVWRGTGPISFGYQWEACTTSAPSSCTAVEDEWQGTFMVPDAFDGWMRVTVTAASPYGSATAASPLRRVRATTTPATGDVGFTGSARVGSLLTAAVPDPGVPWHAQWMRCDAAGGDCRPISGATGNAYLVTTEDLGSRLRLRAVYDGGQNFEDSGHSALVRGALLAPPRFAAVLGEEELWTIEHDGTEARKVLTVSYADELLDVAVSPDGDTIAMITTRGIELVGANGRGRRLLLEAPSSGGSGSGLQSPSSVAFAPSGDALVFAAYSPVDFATAVFQLELATAAVRRLDAGWTAEVPYTDRDQPTWSPRRDRLVYVARNGSQTAIVMAAADGTGEIAVEVGYHVEPGSVTSKPRFSEDGSEVIFSGRPHGDACGEAIYGIDVATHDVTLRSGLHNCDVALTLPSWTGPGYEVLVASSDDTSGGGVATRIETVELDDGDYDVVMPHTGKPVTALELPQTSVPTVFAHTDESGDLYSDGQTPLRLGVTGGDPTLGIQSFGYGPSVAAPTGVWNASCDGLCPPQLSHEFGVVTSGLPEGATAREVWAQNAAGTIGKTAVRILVDRTAPVPLGRPRVIEFDATAQTAAVAWDTAYDPDLPGGIDGSGVAAQEFRWHTTAAGWSGWDDASGGLVDLTGVPTGTPITVEVRAADAVGNVTTASGVVDWNPPAADPEDEIDGIDWSTSEEGEWMQAFAGVRCNGVALSPVHTEFHGEPDAGVTGAAVIGCRDRSGTARSPRMRVEVCVMAELVFGVFTERVCRTWPEGRRGVYALQTTCRGDEMTYRMRLRWWRLPARRDAPPTQTVNGLSDRTFGCNHAGAWRAHARWALTRTGESLRDNLQAARDDPPRNRDGGTTPGATDNGFVLHTIVPQWGDQRAGAQGLAYRCGIAPVASGNGVWLRGASLEQVGEDGRSRSTVGYRRLSDDGQDRAYAPRARTDAYYDAVYRRLADASQDGGCAAVRDAFEQIKTDLQEGYVPGEGGELDTLKQAAVRHPPLLMLDDTEEMRLIAVESMAENVSRTAPQPNTANKLCHSHRSSCQPPIALAGGDPTFPGIPRLTLRFLRPSRYPDANDTFVLSSNYLKVAGRDSQEAISDNQTLWDEHPSWRNVSYVRTWASGDAGWVQYWFFWYYDTVPGGLGFGWHEGDWEMVQVRYRRLERGTWSDPLRVTFSSHRDKEISCPWSEVTQGAGELGERFGTYVASGTHANFPRPGVWDGELTAVDNARGDGRHFVPEPRYLDRRPRWLQWPGRWGGTPESAFAGYQPSPVGPAFQRGDRWKNPEKFDADAHRCHELQPEDPALQRQAAPFEIDAAQYADGVVTVDWHRDAVAGAPSILWTAKADGTPFTAQKRLDLGVDLAGTSTFPWPHAAPPTELLGTEIDELAALGRSATHPIAP